LVGRGPDLGNFQRSLADPWTLVFCFYKLIRVAKCVKVILLHVWVFMFQFLSVGKAS
jgi:hypothetical protein